MIRPVGIAEKFVLFIAACLVGGCGVMPSVQSVASAEPQEGAPVIGVINNPNPDSYCSFQPIDGGIVFDQPETWNFLFLDDFDTENGVMLIDGEMRDLVGISRTGDPASQQVWKLATSDGQYSVEIVMNLDQDGPDTPYQEAWEYKGTITVRNAAGSTVVGHSGWCGV